MEQQADIGLIAACQQGDHRAYHSVYNIYRDRVFALCRHMAGNRDDAEDLAQESFVQAFRNNRRLSSRGHFRHVALSHRRQPLYDGGPQAPTRLPRRG